MEEDCIPLIPRPSTDAQATAFQEWHNETYTPEEPIGLEEAHARLDHIAELFLLLGGAEWLKSKGRLKGW